MPTCHRERQLVYPVFALIFFFLILFGGAAGAVGVPISNFVVPYTSYTYDYWGEAVPAPQAYLPSHVITGSDLGVGDFRAPSDLVVGPGGDIYIADAGNNRILVFDSSWQLLRIMDSFINRGEEDGFARPQGIFVTADGSLYVADTGQTRIIQFDSQGELVRIIGPPQSEVEGVLPAGFDYRPLKVGVDLHDRIYVISQDLPEGLISFSEDGRFRGFLGAPKVTPNLADYIWSRLATREQRARMQVFLPTEYTNFDLDPDGFIYATTKDEDQDDSGQKRDRVKMLNAKGEDLLRRLGFDPPVGDVQYPDQHSTATRRRASLLVDITVQDFGVYSVLDSNRGRVFTYDNNGNLLYMFGSRGTDYGQMMQPVALDYQDYTMLVLDAQKNAIMIYEPTDYALLIWAALDAYNRGDYELTEALWRKVLELNGNYDLAYTGIGRTLVRRELYGEAMHFFKLGNNRAEYSDAFNLYRRGVIYEQFSKAFFVLLALGLAIVLGRKLRGRKDSSAMVQSAAATTSGEGLIRQTLRSLKYGFYCLFHPGEGFYQLKYGRRGTVAAATVILGLVVAAIVFSRQYTGFIFNTLDLTRLSLPLEIASVVVPFLLWSAVNWALTTLMEGKGSFRDIYIASAFALIPLVLFIFPLTILSNYITAEEGTFYHFSLAVGVLWTAVLVVFGAVMTTHEYDFAKTIWTCLLTIFGMAFAMFLGFLFINLSEQVFNFINDIVVELMYRT